MRLEVARRIVHVLGDRAGAQHDAEGIDRSVVNDGTSVRIGLVDRFEDVVVSLDDGQAGDDTRRRLPFSPSHHATSRRP
jgi:hypothetical protein